MNLTVSKPVRLSKEFLVPPRLLTGPGPSNCPASVLEAAGQQLLGIFHPEVLELFEDVKAGLRYVFQTTNEYTFALSGTGHAGMEAAICNLLQPGDKFLVLVHGIWGQRAAEMGRRNGSTVNVLEKPLGEAFTLAEIEEGLKQYKPNVLFVCHGESSTGGMQSLEGIGPLCHRYECLLLVDSVASLGAVPILMDSMGIDVLYSCTQKGLSAPPGMAPISFNNTAMSKILSRQVPPRSFYLDALMIGQHWGCAGQPHKYHHTVPTGHLYALRQALVLAVNEGLENMWTRHATCGSLLQERIEELGLELFVKNKEERLPSITSILIPDGVDGKKVQNLVLNDGVEVAIGLGPTAGKVWRIGLLGNNSRPQNVERVAASLRKAVAAAKNCTRL